MESLRLTIAYDGTDYFGFQVQPNHKTIQGELERALSQIGKTPIRVIGAGRTDRGVHAEGQVVSFRHDLTLPNERIPKALNRYLPRDIRVLAAQQTTEDFHARYSAKEKTYRYQIVNSETPHVFLRNYALFLPEKLDIQAIKEALPLFLGTQDFTSFQATGSSVKNPIRTLTQADLTLAGSLLFFRFSANGFLYNMVRNMVGTLLLVGRGKIRPAEITEILARRDRRFAGTTAPPQGLFLEHVQY